MLFLYRWLPDPRPKTREIWPGAVVAVLLLEVVRDALEFYFEDLSDFGALYGSLGALMALLVFVFAAANVLVFGAEFASEWSRLPPPMETRPIVARGHARIRRAPRRRCAERSPSPCSPRAACGGEDVRDRRRRPRQDRAAGRAGPQRVPRARARPAAIEQVLDDLDRAVRAPSAPGRPRSRSRGRNEATTIDAFLTDVLKDIDGYWTRTFAAADLPEAARGYVWVPPGRALLTGCG